MRSATNYAFMCISNIYDLHHEGSKLLFLVLLVYMYIAASFSVTFVILVVVLYHKMVNTNSSSFFMKLWVLIVYILSNSQMFRLMIWCLAQLQSTFLQWMAKLQKVEHRYLLSDYTELLSSWKCLDWWSLQVTKLLRPCKLMKTIFCHYLL